MPQSTEEVFSRHMQAFGAGDVARLLADYSEQSFIIAPDGSIFRGPAQIKPVFEMFIAEFGKHGATFTMGTTVIEGDIAYITWSADTPDNTYEFGSDTFIIRNGIIEAQTFAAKITPKK